MATPHFRKCWHCGNVDVHGDSAGHAVRCTKCLSADTRRFSRQFASPKPAAAEVTAPGTTLDLTWLFLNHATVRAAITRGATPQQVILLLASQNNELLDRLLLSTQRESAASTTARQLELEEEVARLTGLIRKVIRGDWSVTDLQESIGDLQE